MANTRRRNARKNESNTGHAASIVAKEPTAAGAETGAETGAGAGAGAGTETGAGAGSRSYARSRTAAAARSEAKGPEADAQISVEPPEAPTAKTRRKRTSKKTVSAQQSAQLIVDTFDVLASSIHREAGLEIQERVLIEPALARILERTDTAQLGRYTGIIDPLLLGAGILLYARRVSMLTRKPENRELKQTLKATDETDPSIPPRLTQNLKVQL